LKGNKNIINIFKQLSNNDDFQDFKNLMNNKVNKITNKDSFIYKNYKIIRKELVNMSDDEISLLIKKVYLNSIINVIIDRENNEFEIFENLNTKKVELETIELIKNFVIMHVDESNIESNEKELSSLFNELVLKKFCSSDSSKIDNVKLNNFIKSYVQIEKNVLDVIPQNISNNTDDIYELFKGIIAKKIGLKKITIDEYNDLLKELSEDIDFYLNLTDPNMFFDDNSPLHQIGDILFMFSTRQIYTPLL